MNPTTVETATIRPARLNFKVTDGDAWTMVLTLVRNKIPINLTGAVITVKFIAASSGLVTSMVYTATDLAAGKFAVGQIESEPGKYAINVAEVGATPRTMIKGVIAVESIF